MTNHTTKTSAENLHDLLIAVAVAGADFMESQEADPGYYDSTHMDLLNAIDDFQAARHEHEEQQTILSKMERDAKEGGA